MTMIRGRHEDRQGPAPEVEGEIRELVRRDVAHLRKPQPETGGELGVNNLNSLIQRVSGTSVLEIEKLIAELQTVRDSLQHEGQRRPPAVPETALRREDAADLPKGRARALRAARGPGAVDRASGRVSALWGSRLRRKAKCRPWSGVPRQRRQHAREPIRGAGVSRQMGGVPWPHLRPTSPDLIPSNSR